jgi:hypothetical protein
VTVVAVVLLAAGIPAAEAAPLDRFMQPNPPARPLLQWDCGPRGGWRGKARTRRC